MAVSEEFKFWYILVGAELQVIVIARTEEEAIETARRGLKEEYCEEISEWFEEEYKKGELKPIPFAKPLNKDAEPEVWDVSTSPYC